MRPSDIFSGIDFSDLIESMPAPSAPVVVAEPELTMPAVIDNLHFKPWDEFKTQDITLDQLRRTNRELNNGQPMHGIHHFQLVEQILDIIRNNGLQGEVFDMFAAKSGGSQYPGVSLNEDIAKTLKDPEAHLNVEAYTVRRIYTTIHIKGFDDGESDQSIAVSYHQQGIQVAIGRNVRICHNQTILGADRSFQTYSKGNGRVRERITYLDILAKVAEWMQNIHNITYEDDKKIEQMKRTIIPPAKIFMLIGMLNSIRVAVDSKLPEVHLNAVYPLNDTQIHNMTEQLILRNALNKQVTAWDFYNIATDMYKAHLMDTTQLFPQNNAMMEFIGQYIMMQPNW